MEKTRAESSGVPAVRKLRTLRFVAALLAAASALAVFFCSSHWFPHIPHTPNHCPLSKPPHDGPLYPENRARYQSIFAESFPRSEALVALATSSRSGRLESDMELGGWRTSSNVLYLLGGEFTISDAVILLEGSGGGAESLNITLFLPNQTERETIFMGGFPRPKVLRAEFGVKDVKAMADFASYVKGKQVLTTSKDELAKAIRQDLDIVEESAELQQVFIQARFVKSKRELAQLEYASRVASWAHKIIARHIKYGRHVNELALASLFEHLSTLCGARLQAYPAIVGAGGHAAVLHYRTGENVTAGYAPIDSGALVLVDAAGEYGGYASDLTRTWARSGKWTKKTKALHAAVMRAQQAAIDAFEEGVETSVVIDAAYRSLLKSLIHMRFFVEGHSVDELLEAGVLYVFMPHGLGHPVGLDVHDPVPSKYELSKVARLIPSFVTQVAPPTNFKIFRGYAATLEPGLYLIPGLLAQIKSDPTGLGRFINWDVVDKLADVGGVRNEDVVIITHSGKKVIITR
ncbi:hypothetical protein HDU87_007418 [Geranomyces variabilis]|uniref:Aminopeptidase P N-terminal domain-containing protein n=1 Tax=Geranomyces variabilis TaxID=109894 RepID=A0AAD5TPG1_9FUNG|nr:hypothetical protein HDU87_007418 [Geranomyces variabilis]